MSAEMDGQVTDEINIFIQQKNLNLLYTIWTKVYWSPFLP